MLHANAIRLEAELPDSEEDDLLSAEMELFATFEDIMDHVPPPKRKDGAYSMVVFRKMWLCRLPFCRCCAVLTFVRSRSSRKVAVNALLYANPC